MFFDENMIKQSFQKKKQITESEKSEDFKKVTKNRLLMRPMEIKIQKMLIYYLL